MKLTAIISIISCRGTARMVIL